MRQAARVVALHHSKSTLPTRALERLRAARMDGRQWCYVCNQWARRKDTFCGSCGWELASQQQTYAQQDTTPPWHSYQTSTSSTWDAQGRQPPESPGRRPGGRPNSRGRQKGQGKGQGKDKGKHKGGKTKDKSNGKADKSTRPDLTALPAVPAPPPLSMPGNASSAPNGTATEAQQKLDALLSTLRSSRESLPAEVVNLLGDHEAAASQQKGRALHRAVTSQTTARKELLRVQDARRAYLASWAEYTTKLQALLQKQQADQETALTEFNTNEAHWKQQLREASSTLAALSGEIHSSPPSSEDEHDAEMKSADKDPWVNATELRKGQAELGAALAKAKEKAELAVRDEQGGAERLLKNPAQGSQRFGWGWPQQGPGLSLRRQSGPPGAGRVLQWTHTALFFGDFVPDFQASFLALQLELDVKLQDAGLIRNLNWTDPRFEDPLPEDVGDASGVDFFGAGGWMLGQPASIQPFTANGAKGYMDSLSLVEPRCSKDRLDGWRTPSVYSHSSSAAFGMSRGGAESAFGIADTDSIVAAKMSFSSLGHVHTVQFVQPLRVPFKSSLACPRDATPRQKHVGFCPAVSFWFPEELAVPCDFARPVHTVSSQGPGRHILFSAGPVDCLPCNQHHPITPGATQSCEHTSAAPSMSEVEPQSFLTACADTCSGLSVDRDDRALHKVSGSTESCDLACANLSFAALTPDPGLLSVDDALHAHPSRTLPLTTSGIKRNKPVPSSPMGDALLVQERQDVGDSSWLTPGLQPSPDIVQTVGSRAPGRYTCFDVAEQVRVRHKWPHWTDKHCLWDAIESSTLHQAVGRLLKFPVQNFEGPLALVSAHAVRLTHRSVVFTCSQAPTEVLVADVPIAMSPQTFLLQSCFAIDHPWHQLFSAWPLFTCKVNGEPFDCFLALPALADVVEIQIQDVFACIAGGHVPDVVPLHDFATAAPLPSERSHRPSWAHRPLRAAPASPITFSDDDERAQIATGGLDDGDSEEEAFAVFDVYFHSRVLTAKPWHSTQERVAIALEATPQISAATAHYRVIRHLLEGFPRHQIVLWGDLLPGASIIPVAFGQGPGAVCTVEALHSYSASQLIALACRRCQLPGQLIEDVNELNLQIYINAAAVHPLDPRACADADTACLQGGLLDALGGARPVPALSQGSSSSSSTAAYFGRPAESAASAGFYTIFAENTAPSIAPIPIGAFMADLIAHAHARFPTLGARCGHRVLQKPIDGFPPIQICVWGEISVDERIVQVVTDGHDRTVHTVRARNAHTPTQLAAVAAGSALSQRIAQRIAHLVSNGRPCQPNAALAVQGQEVFYVVAGPPPSRLPGSLALVRRWAASTPISISRICSTDISDADQEDNIFVHSLGLPPASLSAPVWLQPAAASALAISTLGGDTDATLCFPPASPITPGTPPHAVLAGRPCPPDNAYAILDLRRILVPPVAPFQVLPIPSIISHQTVLDLLGTLVDHLRPVAAIYLDGELLGPGAGTHSSACTLTFISHSAVRSMQLQRSSPAVLDTFQVLLSRPGFGAFPGTVLRTSTSTTTTSVCPDTGASHVDDELDFVIDPNAASSDTAPSVLPLVTNPDLLDFLRDECAADRIDSSEMGRAYTLFDGVLQTRLADKPGTWTVADCMRDARTHFSHLGADVRVRLIWDVVDGLPQPQIIGTPSAIAHRVHTVPIDARPAGRGICVIDAPLLATPFSISFQASTDCQFMGLHQQIANKDCVFRAAGRVLQPFDQLAGRADTARIEFRSHGPQVTLQPPALPSERVSEALLEARDLGHACLSTPTSRQL